MIKDDDNPLGRVESRCECLEALENRAIIFSTHRVRYKVQKVVTLGEFIHSEEYQKLRRSRPDNLIREIKTAIKAKNNIPDDMRLLTIAKNKSETIGLCVEKGLTQEYLGDVCHAATCGCGGCWGRMLDYVKYEKLERIRD
jgi:hypothetical protein